MGITQETVCSLGNMQKMAFGLMLPSEHLSEVFTLQTTSERYER